MVRFFHTRVELPLSVEAFIALRNDIGFEHFNAEWENQVTAASSAPC